MQNFVKVILFYMDSSININHNIPEHWKWVTLDEIGIIVSGGTPSTKEPEYWNGNIPWVTPADLSNYDDVYISQGMRNISQIGLENSSAVLLPENSIIFSSRAPIGYVSITKNKLATNQGFKNLILVSDFINPKYVYYYLKTVKELAENMASGTTFLEISATKFKEIPFPLAPIEEQNRIVKKIEELFSLLDNCKKDLNKSKELTQKLIKKTIFNQFNNIKEKKPLFQLAKISMGQSPDSMSFNSEGIGIPFFQGKKEFGKMYPVVEKWTTEPIRTAQKTDILMSVRAPVGDVNIANLDCCIGRGLCAIKFSGYYKFLYFFLNSIKDKINNLGSGSTFNSISRDIIDNIDIPIISFDEQFSLINELEIKIDTYESTMLEIENQILNTENLKNKVLLDAFQGKLTLFNNEDKRIQNLLSELHKGKELLLNEYLNSNKKRKKTFYQKKNLIDILKSEFKNYSFTFEEIIKTNTMSTDDLEKEFRILIQTGVIKKQYENISKSVKFTIK